MKDFDFSHESMMGLIREDTKKATEGGKPSYLVNSDRISLPFTNLNLAVYWQQYMKLMGLELDIIELLNYDWDTNLANIKFHDTSTEEGMEGLLKTVAIN